MSSEKKEFTKYERARIIGARGLQIAMDAPLLLKISKEELNGINFDPLKIAEKELDSGVLPITVSQPLPQKRESSIDKVKIDIETPSDESKEKFESDEVEEISRSGDIMKLNEDDDEIEELDSDSIGEEIEWLI